REGDDLRRAVGRELAPGVIEGLDLPAEAGCTHKVRISPWRLALATPMMSSVTTLRHWLGRLGKDTLYLLTGLPMGILTFTVAVTGWSLGLGLLITLIGFPVLLVTALALRGL